MKSFLSISTTLAVLVMLGSAVQAQTNERPVKLFEKGEFRTGGWVLDLPAQYTQLGDSKRNEASSIKVAPGWIAILYGWKDNWMDGPFTMVEGNVTWLGNSPYFFNDKTRGVRAILKDPNPDATRISYVGSATTYNAAEFRELLQRNNRTLLNAQSYQDQGELRSGQCVVAYADADAGDKSADFGALVCAVELADGLTLEMSAVYGGCDFANKGAGGTCEVGIYSSSLKFAKEGFRSEVSVKGPRAEACTEISTERTCYGSEAELANVSVEISDSRGNGVGCSVGVGVGYGASGGYEDGVLSAEFDLKIIAGGSISFNLGVEEDTKIMIALGKAGYAKLDNQLVAASQRVIFSGYQDVGSDVVNASGKLLYATTDGINYITRSTAGALDSFASGAEEAAKTTLNTLSKIKFW